MPTAGQDFDLVLDDLTNQTGFMLRRPKGGEDTPMLQVEFLPPLRPAYSTAVEDSYTQTDPSVEKTTVQSDWRKGCGETTFQQLDSGGKRYAQSFGCDARFLHRILLGPTATARTTTSFGTENLAVTNAGFETWTTSPGVPDSWTGYDLAGSSSFTKETTTVRTGGNSAKLTLYTSASYQGLKQVINHSSAAENVAVTVGVYYYLASGQGATKPTNLRIYIYQRGTEVALTTVGPLTEDAWTAVTVVYTPASGESPDLEARVAVLQNAGSGNPYIFLDDVTITATESTPSTLGTITCEAEYGGNYYLGGTNGLFKWDATNTRWDFQEGCPRYITALEPFTESSTSYLFIACGLTRSYWYWDGTTFKKSQLAGPDDKAQYFVGISGVLWKNETASAVASSSTPTTGSWSTPVTIDDTAYSITGLVNHKGNCYVSKTNGWFDENSGSPVNLIPALVSLNNTNGGINPLSWNAKAYAPFGAQSVFEYNDVGSAYLAVSLSTFTPGMLEYSGQMVHQVADEQYLYGFFINSTDTRIELVAGRYETVDGVTAWAWHPIKNITGTAVKAAGIVTLSSIPYLFCVITVSGTDTPYQIILPDKYSDITQATSYSFATGGIFISPYYELGYTLEDKAILSYTLYSKSLAAAKTVAVDYRLDNTAAWTSLGTFNTSPIQTLYFSTTAVTKGRRIQFRLTLATDATTVSPEPLAFALRTHTVWAPRRAFTLPIVIEDDQLGLQGTRLTGVNPYILEGRLRNAATLGWVKLLLPEADTSGNKTVTTYYVRLRLIRETKVRTEKSRYGQKLFEVTATEVKLS